MKRNGLAANPVPQFGVRSRLKLYQELPKYHLARPGKARGSD
jgi:hypothetical protein